MQNNLTTQKHKIYVQVTLKAPNWFYIVEVEKQ